MSKLMVENSDGIRVPYLRGILIRSLTNAGMGFDDAFTVADSIRDQLKDTEVVTTQELESLAINSIRKSESAGVISLYESRNLPYSIQVESHDGQFADFSTSKYRVALESIGMLPEQAQTVVDRMSGHLLKLNKGRVTSRHISEYTYNLLKNGREYGPDMARRWLVWREFIRSNRPIVYLIGGTAGSGKSSTAAMLANRLDIVRMQSTDMLREVMRTMIPKELQPLLHTSSFNAWQVIQRSHIEDENDNEREAALIDGYSAQADLLSLAIKAVLQRATQERVSVIVEGVHVHPALITKVTGGLDALVIPIMLGVINRKSLRSRIKGRGKNVPHRRAQRYLDYFDSIWQLQSFLLSEADQANVPIIVSEDRDEVFREIMQITIDALSVDFSKTPEEVF